MITNQHLNGYKGAGTVTNKRQVGRPRLTTRHINPQNTAAMIVRRTRGTHGSPCCGNKGHTKGPILTDRLSRDHMQWSRHHLRYTHRQF